MKRTIFTLFLMSSIGLAHAQSGFGEKDVILTDFDTKTLTLTDSLWTDTLKTTPITTPSANVSIVDNPYLFDNLTAKAAKFVRPVGFWKPIYIRFNRGIILSQTPNFQLQIYPLEGKSPSKTSVTVNMLNDKGEVVGVGGSKSDLNQEEWGTVNIMMGKQKSSSKYNVLEILINPSDTLSSLGGTEYLIDEVGFKAPADGVELPATVFYETFGPFNATWQQCNVPGQIKKYNSDNNLIEEIGKSDVYTSIKGFTSGIPFTFVNADTLATMRLRTWGMSAKYEGASGDGRLEMNPDYPGALITGPIDVKGYSKLNLNFGVGTQEWWAYNDQIGNARPKVEISVNGGAFYEIFTASTFLQATGNFGNFDWGQPAEYEDQIFVPVVYPITDEAGVEINPNTINIKVSYKEGCKFWIDDLWFAGKYTTTGINDRKADVFSVYPNPATDFIMVKGAQKVTITDLGGRLVKEVNNTEKVDVSTLNKGAYLVKSITDGKLKVGKLIKE